ncbi:MAG: GNAT family N-acetyltransferase [Pontixanthobacter sp.]
MVSISYHDTVNVLQGTMEAPSPFDRWQWFELLAQSGVTPVIVQAQDGENQTFLPLARRGGKLESLVNWYSFHWRPSGSHAPTQLRAIANDLLSQTHRVTLWPVPDEDGSATTLEKTFTDAGWMVQREKCDENHVLEVGGRSFSDYWASRPGPLRTILARKAKRIKISIQTTFNVEVWSEYEAIYANSWKPQEGNPALLRRFAEQEGDAGRLRLAVARFKGKPVAAQFWTTDKGTAYIHKLAHLDEHSDLSAGTTLSAALFEYVIDQDKVERIDFGTGDDKYKSDWMEAARPRFRLDCLNPNRPRAWASLAKREILRLAQGGGQS